MEAGVRKIDLGIGNLLSGLIGAVLVFLLTIVYGEVQRLRLRRSERQALLRLVLGEMRKNQAVLYAVRMELVKTERPDPPTQVVGASKDALQHMDTFKTDAWQDVRVRLAQLLPGGDSKTLIDHYADLQQALDGREAPTLAGSPVDVAVRYLDLMEDSRHRANSMIHSYLGEEAKEVLQAPWLPSEDYQK